MNIKIKTRISILLCLVLIAFSIQPISVGAASIGEPVPTDVSYWGFDENTTSSVLNQGYNNILCLWDFENHEYLLVKCPDHMYYVPGGRVLIDGDYTGLFNKKDFQDYIRDQIVFNWGTEKGFFNLSASQYFTVYRVSEDGTLNSSEQSEFKGIVNGTAWSASKTKYNALRWLYENDSETYNLCNYALIWSTDSIDYAYTGSGNASIDFLNWANATFLSNINYTAIYFTGGSTLNAAASDIPVYTFYPGGFRFTSPVAVTPTPTPTPIAGLIPYSDYPDTNLSGAYFIVQVDDFNSNNVQNLEVDSYYAIKYFVDGSPTFINYPYANNFFGNSFYGGIGTYVGCKFQKVYFSGDDWVYLDGSSEITWNKNYGTGNRMVWLLSDFSGSITAGSLAGTLHILATNKNQAMFPYPKDMVDPGPVVSVTPTPTSSPTPTPYTPVYVSPTPSPVPSPGVTITPTSGPSETSVKELHGWKKGLQTVLQTVFVGNTEAIEGYFKDAVGGYNIVENPFKQIVDSIYVDGSDQENFNPFENQQVDFVFDVHDQNGDILGGEHTANWRLTILPKTFWEWLKSYSNYFEVVFYLVDASFLGATMKRWLTKQNNEGSETKEGGGD